MPSLGPTELILILAIALIIFGPGKISDLGKSLGTSLREFRRATSLDDEATTTKAKSAQVDETAQIEEKPTQSRS
jgi:sec-independent protein translocase protein TatA